jgi:two-component system response regulator RegA
MMLGTESGFDVVRALRALRPDAVLVMLSGWMTTDATVAAVRAGADHVVVKPIGFREILARIDGRVDPDAPTPSLERAEWEHISRVLRDCRGNVSETARRLRIDRSTLRRRLRRSPPRT